MSRLFTRSLAGMAVAAGLTGGFAVPAFAGQAYQAPGFSSSNASCVGTALDFSAHYGTDGQGYPDQLIHGEIGPSISHDATRDGPGAVGQFNSTMAQNHGPIWVCLP